MCEIIIIKINYSNIENIHIVLMIKKLIIPHLFFKKMYYSILKNNWLPNQKI